MTMAPTTAPLGPDAASVRSPSRSAPSLTKHQLHVLGLMATGASGSEVGAMLGVGYNAVHQLLIRVYRKLGTGSLVETYAVLGWLTVPSGALLAELRREVAA